jgi:hypothetical protein
LRLADLAKRSRRELNRRSEFLVERRILELDEDREVLL